MIRFLLVPKTPKNKSMSTTDTNTICIWFLLLSVINIIYILHSSSHLLSSLFFPPHPRSLFTLPIHKCTYTSDNIYISHNIIKNILVIENFCRFS